MWHSAWPIRLVDTLQFTNPLRDPRIRARAFAFRRRANAEPMDVYEDRRSCTTFKDQFFPPDQKKWRDAQFQLEKSGSRHRGCYATILMPSTVDASDNRPHAAGRGLEGPIFKRFSPMDSF
jgi:hypothetical protein